MFNFISLIQLFKSCLALLMKTHGQNRYMLSTLSGRQRCKLTRELFCFTQPIKNFTEGYTLCFREAPTFAENNSLSLLVLTNQNNNAEDTFTSWSLLRQCLAKFSILAGVEGNVSNKIVVGFITLFSCLSLPSVIWDCQMLDCSIFRGCCKEKASREKGYIKINYYQ